MFYYHDKLDEAHKDDFFAQKLLYEEREERLAEEAFYRELYQKEKNKGELM